ncbi:MAG: hypothetical protein IJ003_01995 [Candidatus Gastranaerophilales bacterium]|nr:hypothetical protein [Candidatus Gastranaerophilales bacterium]
MKISSVKNVENNQNKAYNNKKQNTSFKGVADGLVKFWEFVDNGGRALSFTVEDMCGTNLPRTYKGATAGYKYTGKINVPALIQEAIREFLTGPLMCLVPIVVLKTAKSNMGGTSDTHIENIKNLSTIAQNVDGDLTKASFYKATVEDMLERTVAQDGYKANSKDVKALTDSLEELANLKGTKKEIKKAKANIIDNMQQTFSRIVKQSKTQYNGDDFLTASYSVAKSAGKTTEIGSTGFKNYVGYISSYAQDLFKKADSAGIVAKDSIKSFRNSWYGKRIGVIASMIGITAAIMTTVPKIYTKASGKINPNASAIYDAANNKKEAK